MEFKPSTTLPSENPLFLEIADIAPVMIWIAGPDKRCNYFNRPWLDFTGRELQDELGNGWAEGVYDEDLERCLRIYERSFDARESFSMEYRLRRHDGVYRWILDNGKPVYSPSNEFMGYVGSCIDVTDQKDIQAALESARNAAEAANAAKSEFLANMSHEIRTPLNGILGAAQLLAAEKLPHDQLLLARQIADCGHMLTDIINDVLDFSRIEAGQMKIDTKPFRIETVMKSIRELFDSAARGKGLSFEIVCEPEDCVTHLLGDALRLKQVLINLIGNAIKFTETGYAKLVVRSMAQGPSSRRLRFEIQDSGIGIAADRFGALFTPFVQADSSITRRFGGSGLGLSISKHLVELMGGAIGLNSAVGAGSTFWFELPFNLACQQSPLPPTIAPLEKQRLSGLHCLVVDDTDFNRTVAEQILTREGAQVTLAVDGRQALQQLKSNPAVFDVVLMDVQMPGIDGLAATRAIRTELGLHILPVIAVTAGVLPEQRQQALDAGCDEIIIKPFSLDDLVGSVAHFVRSRAASSPRL